MAIKVIVELQVAAPLGKTIAGSEAMGDLRRLKQILETGEIVLSDASIHEGPHPAQPTAMGKNMAEVALVGEALNGRAVAVVSAAQTRGHGSKRLDQLDSWNRPETVDRLHGRGFDEGQRDVVPLAELELKVDHVIH